MLKFNEWPPTIDGTELDGNSVILYMDAAGSQAEAYSTLGRCLGSVITANADPSIIEPIINKLGDEFEELVSGSDPWKFSWIGRAFRRGLDTALEKGGVQV